MNKSTFAADSDESELLQNLLMERQRVQELEEELERVHNSSKNALEIGSDQSLKLKQLINILRKKYDEAQRRNSESEEKYDQLLLDQDKLKKAYAQLLQDQKVSEDNNYKQKIEELLAENQDKEEELNSLKEQLIKLKSIVTNQETLEQANKEDLEKYKQKQRQFERVVHYLRKRLEEAHLENKELIGTFQQTKQLHELLEVKLEECNAQNTQLEDKNQKLQLTIQSLEAKIAQEVHDRQQLYQEQRNILDTSRKELEEIKHAIIQNFQNFKEEKSKGDEVHLQKINQLQTELEELQTEKKKESEELSASIVKWQNHFNDIQKELNHVQQELEQKKEELLKIQPEYAEVLNSYAISKEQISALERSKEEIDSSLRMAQQHLAKKVRETTLVIEENEELKTQVKNLHNELEFLKLKIIELQNSLELEYQKQKSLQEQYQEGLKSFELHTLKWEEKYFAMQQKWQESESRLCEFKNFEEKYQKMHNILNHLSNLLGKPIVLPGGEIHHSFDAIASEKDKNSPVEQLTLFDLTTFTK